MYHALINLLKSENRYFSKKEICERLPEHFEYSVNKNNHDECVRLWSAKDYINNHIEEFNQIIINNRFGDLKIPTEEELKKFLEHELKLCCLKFDRYWKKAKAFKLIDQTTIVGQDYEIVRKG